MKDTGVVTKVSGPVIHARMTGAINDLVRVGKENLLGEIIEVREDERVIQVYEDTTGVAPGDSVTNTKKPLSVALAPGLLGQVLDGTQRPLAVIKKQSGIFIARGADAPALDLKKKWEFTPTVSIGDTVETGTIIGTVQENNLIEHRILVPPGISGEITSIKKGSFTVEDTIAVINGQNVQMLTYWPVRQARPYTRRYPVEQPLVTGTRVLDFLYPVAKGGVAAIPGPFGAGKTVTQQQIAKWCDADIIVYIGCGERGNEMTEVLEEFPHLKDPKTGEPLMSRTILVANTSNMPVAAREASVYTGIAIAEYFRDQGYAVALMADSTSRWAEAMREISGRLEEMPGEEGYPAYLSKRLAEFYERAGVVDTLSGEQGSVTIIGAVSPPGGDFSEPVTQNTLRLARCFWALDAKLADKRHFPSINWLNSYSLYTEVLDEWFDENVAQGWAALRKRMSELLQQEAELQEIVQLVGQDALPVEQQLALVTARMVREDFLQQNAFHDEDTFCPMNKQLFMAGAIFAFYNYAKDLGEELDVASLRESEAAQYIAQLKYEANTRFEKDLKKVESEIKQKIAKIGGAQ